MKKGFTLIELLAVIIIIAIISLISVPLFFGLIEDAKTAIFMRSADNILHATELKYAQHAEEFNNTYTISYVDGELYGGNELKIKGMRPDFGLITMNEEGLIKMALFNETLNKCITKTYAEEKPSYNPSILTKEECLATVDGTIVINYPQVTDSNPGIICGDTLVEDYAGNTTCHVRSIEDLVALSNLSKTSNFSTKTIIFETNFDFESDSSYINPNTTVYGDINGNSSVESLKIELTTANGFYPIGGTISFYGSINGNGNYIKNLYINRPTMTSVGFIGVKYNGTTENLNIIDASITGLDNVGFIGYAMLNSITKGINIKNASVSGRNAVGILAGRAYQTSAMLSTNTISGNVVGIDYVGGALGYQNTGAAITNVIVDANVSGNNHVGGIVGYSVSTVVSSIYKSGSVTSVDTVNVGRVVGTGSVSSVYANDTILVNGSTVTGTATTKHGQSTSQSHIDFISFYNGILDTYIGGDEDTNGYYFDYNSNGQLVPVKVDATITLTGSGTQVDPYLLYTTNDFKQATYQLNKYYKVMADLDFINEPFYPFGTTLTNFTGSIDGNGKTLSNIVIHGTNNAGFVGVKYTGTVEDLNIINITITGFDNVGFIGYAMLNSMTRGINITNATVSGRDAVGILAGRSYQTGATLTINNVSGNVSGNNYVGGALGYQNNPSAITQVVVSANVNGNAYVGGVVGYTAASLMGSIYKSGSVTSVDLVNVGRVCGYGNLTNSYANDTILVNGSTVTGTATTLNGGNKTPAELLLQSTYSAIGLNFTDLTADIYKWNMSGSNIWITRN